MSKSAKTAAGRHEAAFASWLRRNGYAPSDGIEQFLESSDYFRNELVPAWTQTSGVTFGVRVASAVPELHSYALMLLGLAVIGGVSRRRRN